MGYWNSGQKGHRLEELINITNAAYREKGLALVSKIPTPVTPVRIDPETSTITLAYFEKKSSVDFIGCAQGLPICFDAKETKQKNLPLRNIHEHQIEFMADFEKQQGIAFLIVYFVAFDKIYYLPYTELIKFWDKKTPKSIPHDAFDTNLLIKNKGKFLVHYLEPINTYLANGTQGDDSSVSLL